MKKICAQCGKEFDALRASRKYCSTECFQKATKSSSQMGKTKEDRIIVKLNSDVPITIAVLADAHNNMDYINWFVDEVRKHDNWYVMINGDLWDADQYSSFAMIKPAQSLSQSVQDVRTALLPIADRIIGFVWGNHEERCFKAGSGRGTMPSYFDIFFEAIKTLNPNFQVAELMQSFIVDVTVKDKTWKVIFKHGKSAGKTFGVMEFHEVSDVNEKVDAVVLSHLHLPAHIVVKIVATKTIEEEEKSGGTRIVHYIRTTSGVDFAPYQDKANFYASPLGITRLIFNNELKVELT
jgi:predicted phosphodiesterase